MNQQIHSGPHLDADQLSTFVEGVASARARDQMLAHLAGCDACREMVFLLQGSVDMPPATAAFTTRFAWRNWLMPMGLAGAALACGITALVYFRVHSTMPERVQQSAVVQPPNSAGATPPPSDTQAAPSISDKRSIGPRQRSKPITSSPGAAPGAVGAAAGAMLKMKPTAPPADAIAATPTAAPVPAQATAVAPQQVDIANPVAAAPVPAPTPATGANKAAVEQPSISNRSLSQLSYRAPLPALKIEHNRGPDDGLSELSGRVTDASGALVAGATVTLRDAAGSTREATTAADGKFNLAGVAAGKYDLSVTARGFESNRQSISLQPRDVAVLDSVLKVGASSETVTVTASAMTLETDLAQVSTELPGHKPAVSSVTNGKRVLSMDAAGTLFLSRNRGRSWKKVRPVWMGKVTEIELAASAESSQLNSIEQKRKSETSSSSKTFQLTTESGAVWVSQDGTHWRAK